MAAIDVVRGHAVPLGRALGVEPLVTEEGGSILVLLPKVRLPEGVFGVASTDLLFIADHAYPFSALDMFWTEPGVVRPDGTIPQNAEVIEHHLGRPWRRFSWHRNGAWSPSSNGLLDHYSMVEARWRAEVNR